MSPQNIRGRLSEIDAHAEAVAVKTTAGSDMNELAFAIHNLCDVIRDLSEQVDGLIAGRR